LDVDEQRGGGGLTMDRSQLEQITADLELRTGDELLEIARQASEAAAYKEMLPVPGAFDRAEAEQICELALRILWRKARSL
jgi:hypothetical protein